jgi:hypothetical protein
MHAATSRVENSAHGSSCQPKLENPLGCTGSHAVTTTSDSNVARYIGVFI